MNLRQIANDIRSEACELYHHSRMVSDNNLIEEDTKENIHSELAQGAYNNLLDIAGELERESERAPTPGTTED